MKLAVGVDKDKDSCYTIKMALKICIDASLKTCKMPVVTTRSKVLEDVSLSNKAAKS